MIRQKRRIQESESELIPKANLFYGGLSPFSRPASAKL
jgi:hypothetical protein